MSTDTDRTQISTGALGHAGGQRLARVASAGAAPLQPPSPLTCAVKSLLDVVLAVLLLVVLSPLMVGVAVVVRANLGPGVLFRQTRIGRDGRPFTMLKFRTMMPDRRGRQLAVALERRLTHKSEDDPRHTRVGRWLRRSSLDELPQLWNVLGRDMSLVGPRPELPQVVARYQDWEHSRHLVRPGITGLWQISARGDGMMQEFTHLDVDYVRRLSLLLDLSILLRTIPVLIIRRGA